MLSSTAYAYTPFDLNSGVPETLDNISAGIAGVLTELRRSLSVLTGGANAIFGLDVTAGAFPAVSVAGGYLLDDTGQLHVFTGGTLTLAAEGALTQSVFVTADKTVDAGAVVPDDALAVLAIAVNNGGGTAFTSITAGIVTRTLTYDDTTGLLESVAYTSGPIVYRSEAWTYDSSDQPATCIETQGARTRTTAYTYDAAGNPTAVSTDHSPFGFQG